MTLAEKRSVPRASKLDRAQIDALLLEVPGFATDDKCVLISREYSFKNFYETVAFVNAIAYIANQEDHHPDLAVSYDKCTVSFSTHSAGGLTENDFICAARVNALLRTES